MSSSNTHGRLIFGKPKLNIHSVAYAWIGCKPKKGLASLTVVKCRGWNIPYGINSWVNVEGNIDDAFKKDI